MSARRREFCPVVEPNAFAHNPERGIAGDAASDGEAMRTRAWQLLLSIATLVSCSAVAAPDAAPVRPFADTLEQRLAACAICHGKEGEGTGTKQYYPRIAGKPSRYLYLQLVNFREGIRKYPQMVYLMRYMPDAYLQEIADYYSRLDPPYPSPLTQTLSTRERERGEALVTKGDSVHGIPACVACHGKALTGMLPAIPGLQGLQFDYIAAQLSAWKSNARTAKAPDCMREIAAKLTGPDIAVIAKWIASQPAVTGARPAPETRQKLPLSCGSQFD